MTLFAALLLAAVSAHAIPTPAGAPVFERRSFTVHGEICALACLGRQPFTLTMTFDLERGKQVNDYHAVENFQYKLELTANEAQGFAAHTIERRGGRWTLAKEASQGKSLEFQFEVPVPLAAGIEGTVLRGADETYSRFRLLPYCAADLKTCQFGHLSGIEDRTFEHTYPSYWMLSDETFPLVLLD